ncbi:hypothetical protein RJ55_03434 [Drechmeria coniospora]|nr:hypothetical protein RJ55_03434 [Drechmeria coniospora]
MASNAEKSPESYRQLGQQGTSPPPPPPSYGSEQAQYPGQWRYHAPQQRPLTTGEQPVPATSESTPPPPAEQTQQQQPPTEQKQQQPPAEHQHQQPPAEHQHQHQQQPPAEQKQQRPAEQTQQHHPFPPPPPPPGQAQQQQQGYAIPKYDPAAPTFAPPPVAGQGGQQAAALPVETAAAAKKPGWGERFSKLGFKAAAPVNSLAHKLGSQSFLPESMDKECDKAAAILKAFCKKGVYADPSAGNPPTSTTTEAKESSAGVIDPTREKPKSRVLVTIPPKVVSKAVGLAIFTTLRAGFHLSGSTGSGVLVARLPDGSWSPPSGIQVHSVGGGFQIGLDIYDCVCVINSEAALAAFTKTRVSLGTDLAVVAGPYGAGAAVDVGTAVDGSRKEGKKSAKQPDVGPSGAATTVPSPLPPRTRTLAPDTSTGSPEGGQRRSVGGGGLKPVFSYVKSRGFYAGVCVDGTVVVERKEANAAFFGAAVTVDEILKGQVPRRAAADGWPTGAGTLLEVLKGAEAGVGGGGDGPTVPVPVSGGGPTAPVGGDGEGAGVVESGPPPPYEEDGKHAGAGDVKYGW